MTTTFAQLGLPKSLVRALETRGIVEPFPVQEATIPDALAGQDVSGKAPTGSGKTLAFGLPLLTRVERAKPNHPRALILAPTRELADQIKQELAPLAQAAGRNVFAIYGGVGYGPQRNAMRRGVDVLVATPGRLEDLIEQRTVDLSQANIVVVDEADRMADMGFLPAVKRILDDTAKKRQTLLFSATLDGDIAVLSRSYQSDPVRHDAGTVESESIDAKHHFWLVEHHDRVEHTADLIKAADRSIVFTRTRHGADRLAKQLAKLGVSAVAMHGGRSQNQRSRALKAFATYRAQALIATDVAARGIHIDAVASVIHFDPPSDHKDYLHRSGRTARAGATGTVVSLVTGDQKRAVRRMQKDLDLDAPIEAPVLDALDRGGYRIGTPLLNESRPTAEGSRRETRSARPSKPSRKKGGSPNGNGGGSGESVYVANLPWGTTESDVVRLFAPYGDVHQATLINDRRTGRSKGFGFVDMPRPAARSAVDGLHGTKMGGRDLTVRLAKPRTHSR
jgi:superfamily II DNA/RNA helicase